jgi:hypothetical protein
METLTQMQCVACRADAPTVTDTEIAEFHRQVSDWEIVELDGIKRLRRAFSVDARSLGANPSTPLRFLGAAVKATQASPARWCSSPSTAAAASRSSRRKGA